MASCSQETQAGIALSCWFFASVSTVVSNKWLYQHLHFNYPFALTVVHMLVCWVGSYILLNLNLPGLSLPSYDMSFIFQRFAPLSLLFCVNIVLGNISLQYIPISFNQTIKAAVPAFTVIVQIIAQGKRHPRDRYLSLFPIVGGVMLATYYEVNFHAIGFWTAVASCLTTASWAVASGVSLGKSLNPAALLFYIGPFAALWLAIASWFVEYPRIAAEGGWLVVLTPQKIILLLLSGCFAQLLNTASFYVIQKTSPLAYAVAGNFKVVLSIVVSVLIFRNAMTPLNALGCAITIAGVAWYQNIKDDTSGAAVTVLPQLPQQPSVTVVIDGSPGKRT
jgi:drug/metabolite transporter (DMT)-like permease